jgi:hypothetical protein
MSQQIQTLDELREAEPQLVESINRSRNGGARFLAHPIAMLSDVGADLSPDLEKLLLALLPQLQHATPIAYDALTAAEEEGPVTVRLKGLFAWDELETRRRALAEEVRQ